MLSRCSAGRNCRMCLANGPTSPSPVLAPRAMPSRSKAMSMVQLRPCRPSAGIGPGFLTDWLEHDANTIFFWHPGMAPLDMCNANGCEDEPRLGEHFNGARPFVVDGSFSWPGTSPSRVSGVATDATTGRHLKAAPSRRGAPLPATACWSKSMGASSGTLRQPHSCRLAASRNPALRSPCRDVPDGWRGFW